MPLHGFLFCYHILHGTYAKAKIVTGEMQLLLKALHFKCVLFLQHRQIFQSKLAELTSNFRNARNYYVSSVVKLQVEKNILGAATVWCWLSLIMIS